MNNFMSRKFITLGEQDKSLKDTYKGHLGGSVVGCLPLAQGVIPESRDQVPRRDPRREPASPSARVSASLSLCVSHE